MRIPSGIFWRWKIDEILTMSFYICSPYDFAHLVFFKSSQPSVQVFAKHGFASESKQLEKMPLRVVFFFKISFSNFARSSAFLNRRPFSDTIYP